MDRLGAHRRKRHERTIISPRSTRRNLSSSWSVQAPDQHSTRLVRQSYLECLDRLYRLERRVHEEIQEVHSVMNLLDNYQPDATMEDSDGCDSTIDSQAGLDSLNAILPPESSNDPCFVLQHALHKASFGVVQSLSEGTEGLLPHGARSCADYVTRAQHSMCSAGIPAFHDPRVMESSSDGVDARSDLPLHGASDSVHEPAAKPFQGIYFEENASSSFAARPDAELFVPVGQVSQAKVKCTWERCSALVNKDNLTRHVKEVHEGKIKAVCACCGKEFKRPYQMNEHRLRTGCGMS